MVQYIRFLRTPRSDVGKKTVDISAVVAVTTDLGDAFFGEDVELLANVVEANHPNGILCSQAIQWQASSRALKFAVHCPGKYISRPVRLHVTTKETETASQSLEIPKILDVWSCVFLLSNKQRTDPIVERRIVLSNRSVVRMWEETGDSIARHIWDASLGFLAYFAQALSTSPVDGMSMLAALFKSSKVRRLRVLELGAGCGIVGIALAQLVKCDLLLTDLEDAQEILASNIRCAAPMAGSTVRSEVLDWASSLDDSSNANYDLILVSDCIYNPDSSLHLVETLRQLAARTPETLILVGFKRRHTEDDLFFARMRKANFDTVETLTIPLPYIDTDQDVDKPAAEFFTYKIRCASQNHN
ncbi:uncharacterized protein PV07_08993 [Cladophialophora immunda]|uniref:Methyltransferase small domain-containing protein n=1 Tax=Cladophialophora immunda TaxID=569365 RepID=A0A0D1ZDM7_9EURO|nr:uncharacterized protein PV07_08993 [Cladophialophora immunda]KIW25856.1 hypothetical protein PV07_08993 [Cladophialophora immunda]OQV09922.1 hypothetical protein CLAIMM_13995 [Cladophialophora immunda]